MERRTNIRLHLEESGIMVRTGKTTFFRSRLVNASDRGACIEVPRCSQKIEQVHLYLKNKGRFVTLIGRVTWTRPIDENTVHLGLQLEPVPCDAVAYSTWVHCNQFARTA